MVRFKCLLSGNVFQFEHVWDVEEMRKHPQYMEIDDGVSIKDRNYSAARSDTSLQEEKQNTKEKVKKSNKKTAKVEE